MSRLYYRKTDRKAILTLLSVIVAVLSLLHAFGDKFGKQTGITPAADSLQVRTAGVHSGDARGMTDGMRDNDAKGPYYAAESHHPELFFFDPNTADSTALLRLGLQPWQVRSIYKYRSRGGIYRRPGDFARLYGLTAGQYNRLRPYIRISPDFLPASLLPEAAYEKPDTVSRPKKLAAGEHIALDTADSTTLLQVPGIGRYFARRIVGYGKRLGGYVSVNQLDEIDGFPSEAKQYFTIGDHATQQLDINNLSASELRRHPYITFRQAQALTDYRRMHGPIRDMNALKTLPAFTPDNIERLRPYVKF